MGTVAVDELYWRELAGNAVAECDSSGSATDSSYEPVLVIQINQSMILKLLIPFLSCIPLLLQTPPI
jgi:hypothetical protein